MSMKDRDEDQIKSNKILTPLFLLPYVQWSEINKKVQYRYIGTYTQKVRFWLQYLFSTYLFVIALFFPFSSIQTVPCNNDAIYVHDFYYFFIETIMIFTEPYCWITFFMIGCWLVAYTWNEFWRPYYESKWGGSNNSSDCLP